MRAWVITIAAAAVQSGCTYQANVAPTAAAASDAVRGTVDRCVISGGQI